MRKKGQGLTRTNPCRSHLHENAGHTTANSYLLHPIVLERIGKSASYLLYPMVLEKTGKVLVVKVRTTENSQSIASITMIAIKEGQNM